ncbi:hypothetical protein G7Y89_g2669 [Cudoniella acicularis]|uniref:Amidoligase enzyme n=1 Tax=Cudoniella acicularis TaxID=354080 RepID=A0A8H4W8F1_9HELO|nr:hypothetical protein G7Y89_g2669 [Cudoniella acicularis]
MAIEILTPLIAALRARCLSTISINKDPVNYGVELEFVFAFHEGELDLGQTNGIPNTLSKNLSYFQREQYPEFSKFKPSEFPNLIYNSWGVQKGNSTKLDAYDAEPQAIVKRKIESRFSEIPTKISGTLYATKKCQKDMEYYIKWLVPVDHSVCGLGLDNLPKWLPKRVANPSEWDSYGLELVSPILYTGLPSKRDEISKILNAAVGTDNYKHGPFITNQCGLHVHVEAPKDIKVLKELAVLLLLCEEELSRLHPRSRRPGHASAKRQIDSNRLYFQLGNDPNFGKESDDYLKADCSTNALQKNVTVQQIHQRIRLIKKKTALSQKMCWPAPQHNPNGNQYCLINFVYLTQGEGYAEAIEFRQARGTTSAEEVNHWVDFCVGLVKLAEFYLKIPARFLVKSWNDLRAENNVLYQLMQDIELSDEAIGF